MANNLEEMISQLDGFVDWPTTQKIRFLGWFMHTKLDMAEFSASDIKNCFQYLNLELPRDFNPFLFKMAKKNPPELLKNKKGYSLERRLRSTFDEKFNKRTATVKVERILTDLPDKISNPSEKSFLEEAIKCFKASAFRAAIVMTWNLVYDCFCNYILNNQQILNNFNTQLPKSFPKARISQIQKKDDFSELKESEVIQVARSANIISNDVNKILKDKLDKRNTAAHPSTVTIFPHTTDEYILDLVNNVLLKLV